MTASAGDSPAGDPPAPRRERAGITFFDPSDAPDLMATGIMSMPTMDPPAYEELTTWGAAGGQEVRVLFRQEAEDGREGMSLLWSWFGPGFILPRHSHDADCLYYVVAGEARLGNRRIGAGGGFFVPAGAPYAYTAGPEGIQILEFRNATAFDMHITESLARWGRIVENAQANQQSWAGGSAMSLAAEDDARIRNLLARYCVLLDQDDIEAWVTLFTADATYHVYGRTFTGHDGLRKMMAGAPGGLHLGGPPAIEPVDGDHARAQQNLLFVDRVTGETRSALYDDELVRSPDGWRIASRRCRFIVPTGFADRPDR